MSQENIEVLSSESAKLANLATAVLNQATKGA
jgi:hypothetical protein